jgi:hypothetical protein
MGEVVGYARANAFSEYSDQVKTVCLEKIRRNYQNVVGSHILESMKLDFFPHEVEHLIMRLSHELLAEPLESDEDEVVLSDELELTVSYPSTWWQAFKERYFPMWLRSKFPIAYKEVTKTKRVFQKAQIKVHAVYPKAPVIIREQSFVMHNPKVSHKSCKQYEEKLEIGTAKVKISYD